MISRFFLQLFIALAAAISLLGNLSSAAAADSDTPQYYELRIYTTRSGEQRQQINDYWRNAAIPAYNRMGIQPVGVFTELDDSSTNHIYVLIPCDSLEIFSAIPAKLGADATYQAAARDFLASAKPAYERFESSLLVAFEGMKHLALYPADQKPEVFELRTYMSANESKGRSKIHMFESGEIPLMKEVGLAPIFYGRTLIGPHMPCLVYLTSGKNLDEHNHDWDKFFAAPVWKNLQSDPQYKDNVSGVIKILLQRTAASQI